MPELPRQDNVFGLIREMRKPRPETDDGWVKIGSDSDEISPAWQNGWGNADDDVPAAFMNDKIGHVHFRGQITGGTPGTVAFTLPPGFRPEFKTKFVCAGVTD